MAAIPSGLKVVVSGYSMDEPGGVLRTEVEGGASRFGLDWDRGTQRVNVTIMPMDALKFAIWTAFYHHVIKKGALAFDLPMDSGFGMSPHSGNIMPGSYSASRIDGRYWTVGFVFETENQAYAMSAEDAQAMIDLYEGVGGMTAELLARLAQFVLVDTLVLVGL